MANPTTSELQAHVTNDPNGIGLAWSKSNGTLVGLLNQTGFGTVERPTISGSEIANAIVPSEFDALLETVKTNVRWVSQLGDAIDVGDGTNVRSVLLNAFGDGTTTRSNLAALVQRQGTYAEVQWGAGVSIGLDDVRKARP